MEGGRGGGERKGSLKTHRYFLYPQLPQRENLTLDRVRSVTCVFRVILRRPDEMYLSLDETRISRCLGNNISYNSFHGDGLLEIAS